MPKIHDVEDVLGIIESDPRIFKAIAAHMGREKKLRDVYHKVCRLCGELGISEPTMFKDWKEGAILAISDKRDDIIKMFAQYL